MFFLRLSDAWGRDQLRSHTSSNQKDSNYLDCSLTWHPNEHCVPAGRQWQKILPGAGVTYGSNILITRLGGNNLPLYHIVPLCVVRHTPLQTDYWLKEPLVSQAEFHVAACTTRKKVATYKPNWTMQSKIIQPRAINHDWTLFHTCYNSKCETFDTQELASIMCFELKQDTQTSLGSTQHHSHDFGSYLISYGVDDVHPTIDLVYSRCPQQPASCLNDT